MSHSIHTTKKDLKREQRFAVNDGVPSSPKMTALERDEIKKSVYKLNANWKKQSARRGTPIHAKLELVETGDEAQIVRSLKRRKSI